jgi:hypothetical protein
MASRRRLQLPRTECIARYYRNPTEAPQELRISVYLQ